MRKVIGTPLRRPYALIAGMCLAAVWQFGHGQQWLFDGSFKLQPEYDDNIRLLPGVKDDTFGLTGGMDLRATKDTGVTQIQLRGLAEGTLYGESDSDVPDDGFALFDLGYRHGVSERSKIGLDGRFLTDSTLENAADETDDPADVDQGISSFRVRRNKLDLAPVWTQSLTERSGLDLGYEFVGVKYGSNKDEADLEDYLYHTGNGRFFYRLSERTTLSASLQGFGYSSSDSDSDYTGGTLSAGIEHRFSETLLGDFTLGAYGTDFDVEGESSSESGGLFGASLVKRGERTRLRALASRDLRPSGSGRMREADQILLTVRRDLTQRLELSLRTRFLKTKNIGTENSNERDYVLVEPGITWHLSERMDLAATYRYRAKDERSVDETADGNQVLLSFVYNWPRGASSGQSRLERSAPMAPR